MNTQTTKNENLVNSSNQSPCGEQEDINNTDCTIQSQYDSLLNSFLGNENELLENLEDIQRLCEDIGWSGNIYELSELSEYVYDIIDENEN